MWNRSFSSSGPHLQYASAVQNSNSHGQPFPRHHIVFSQLPHHFKNSVKVLWLRDRTNIQKFTVFLLCFDFPPRFLHCFFECFRWGGFTNPEERRAGHMLSLCSQLSLCCSGMGSWRCEDLLCWIWVFCGRCRKADATFWWFLLESGALTYHLQP